MLRSRYRRIVWFFARAIMNVAWWGVLLPRLGLRAYVRRTRPQRLRRLGRAYRRLAVEMGGVLIKVGQFLSARVDVLPDEITAELAGLQDEVPPEDFEAIRRLAEEELGGSLWDVFAEFEERPLAAASLGQVHRARLRSAGRDRAEGQEEGETPVVDVAVKIQRPGIENIIATDLAALRTVGNWLHRYPPIRMRADAPALLGEFARVLYEEIDYLAEGRNAETLAENYRGRPGVRVPRVAWAHTTKRVLTLEDVYAIKITDYAAIDAAGVDREQVAGRLFDTYLQQIFEDGFFHADPHPGNLFVDPLGDQGEDGREWILTFVDFGMVGRVPPNLRAGLREFVIALGTRDAARLVKSYQMLGMLLPNADLELLERAEATIFERFWGKSMAELRQIGFDEMREYASEFRQIVYAMPFQVPQDLILLGRTAAILAGMCIGLYPEFNPWERFVPHAQELMAEEDLSGWDILFDQVLEFGRALLAIPRRAEVVLNRIERGDLVVRVPEVADQVRRLELATRRMAGGVVFFGLLIGGVLLYLFGERSFGWALLGGALLSLAWVILAGVNRD